VADDPFDLLVEAIHEWHALQEEQQFAGRAAANAMQENVELAELRARQLAKECT